MYNPIGFNEQVSSEMEPVLNYIYRELVAISQAMSKAPFVQLEKLNREPDRPREGMVVLADGTNWDPGSGEGFYGYRGNAWEFLG